MTDTMMTEKEFNRLMATYGSELRRWPDEVRTQAEAFINAHPETASASLESAQTMDSRLDTYEVSTPSDLLAARIRKSVRSQPQLQADSDNDHTKPSDQAARTGFAYWKQVAAAVVVAGVIGYATYPLITPVNNEASDSVWLEAATDLGVSDIYAWVETPAE